MELEEYRKQARNYAKYPGNRPSPIYPTLGLAGEAGEVAEKVKKQIRDFESDYTDPRFLDKISLELGDVLWYVANLATELGLDLNDIAHKNLDKLESRKARGKIGGDGDDR